jgi:hypothetical protein
MPTARTNATLASRKNPGPIGGCVFGSMSVMEFFVSRSLSDAQCVILPLCWRKLCAIAAQSRPAAVVRNHSVGLISRHLRKILMPDPELPAGASGREALPV